MVSQKKRGTVNQKPTNIFEFMYSELLQMNHSGQGNPIFIVTIVSKTIGAPA